jgi:RNA recognition motif-containing protein
MPIDNRGRPRGIAFITYASHELAIEALKAGQMGIKLGQRKLRIEVFKPLETLERDRGEEFKKTTRKQN